MRAREFVKLAETLSDKNIGVLQRAKDVIAKNRDDEIAAWTADVQKNFDQWAGRMLSKPATTTTPAPATPVEPTAPEPKETLASLRVKIANLDKAIEKQKLLDLLLDRARRKGILTPGLESDADASMYIENPGADNYQGLNQKLDQAIEKLQSRLKINKIAFKKE